MPSKAPLLSTPLHGFFLALSFLSRIPVSCGFPEDQKVWRWSFAFHPFCGVILGSIAAAPTVIVWKFLPAAATLMFLSVFYYMAILEWITRFLHFDGFCDCCDSFTSMSATPERRLEIMKDPHAGPAAIGAAGILLIGKTMTLYLLIVKGFIIADDMPRTIAMLISIPAAARLSMLCLAAIGRYPRKDGCAARIVGKVPIGTLLLSVIPLIPLVLAVKPLSAAIAFLLCAFSVFYWKIKADAKIGGVTGDVLGACCESSELAAAIGFLLALEAF